MEQFQTLTDMQLFNADEEPMGSVAEVILPEPVYKLVPSDDPAVADEVTLASLGSLAFTADEALVEAVRQKGFTKIFLRSADNAIDLTGRGVLKAVDGRGVLKLSYYKEIRDKKLVTELDPFHMVEVVNGLDLGARARDALGLSPEDL
ncbi:MAG: phage major tail tube protein [Zymomonas mobilis]|uniref:Major tail tube protein n=1 Tax=Zymomonas mobilis TaxID=542 RepID=A0A542VZ66_ZYMMB|nr:phage major tail tube protein [Zymomonas mobilis]TQL16616.1 hypothetical protein FBY58_0152 [Zymomonas mobilis]